MYRVVQQLTWGLRANKQENWDSTQLCSRHHILLHIQLSTLDKLRIIPISLFTFVQTENHMLHNSPKILHCISIQDLIPAVSSKQLSFKIKFPKGETWKNLFLDLLY